MKSIIYSKKEISLFKKVQNSNVYKSCYKLSNEQMNRIYGGDSASGGDDDDDDRQFIDPN